MLTKHVCRRIRQKNIYNECLQSMCVDVYVKRTYITNAYKACVSTYTSKEHIKRMLTKRGISDEGSSFCTPPRVRRRSEISEFEFKKHFFFCGEVCKPKDSKNSTRWHKVVQVKTVGAPGKVPLKDAILQKCEERNDEVSQVVHVRLSSISDLHAADAQYHKDCFQKFFSARNIKASSIPKEQNPNEKLQKLVDMINAQPKNLLEYNQIV